ncbi:zinc-ribbon domain-containing protein [Mycetocola sp.]|uniref:zinc-ribbon domain-containing protein n=1 Tax=Mycetocola sp. TaxID=1871042 RepID=UPI0039899FAE
MLRPGHLLVRECLEYGRVLDDADPHAFRPATGQPGILRPLEPFARHLEQLRTCAVDAWEDLNLRQYNHGPREFNRSEVPTDSSGIAQYICDNGHRVKKAPNQMNIAKGNGQTGCGVCSNAVVLPGFNSAAQSHPWLADFWSDDDNGGLTLDEVYGAGDFNKYNLRCTKGHLWPTVLGNVTVRGYGCPTCSGRYAIPGETSLATLRPDLLATWNWELNEGIDPDTVKPKSGSKFWWLCFVPGHPTWLASALNRANGEGCPTCSNRKVVTGLNDFVTRFPDAASEWAYDLNSDDPTGLSAYYRRTPHLWRCKEEHVYRSTISERTAGRGCQYCADKIVWPGYNDVATRFAEVVSDWDYGNNDGIEPGQTLAGSRKWNWNCTNGHRQSARAPHRAASGGCTECPRDQRVGFRGAGLPSVQSARSKSPTRASGSCGTDLRGLTEHTSRARKLEEIP